MSPSYYSYPLQFRILWQSRLLDGSRDERLPRLRYAPRERFRSRPSREPGLLTISPLTGRAGLRLDGEADLTSHHELQKALAALPPGAAEIHFELARLKFIDVAATRALIARTLQPPHPRLILHHPPPSLQRLIHLLWPDTNAQFRFSPDSRFEYEPADTRARPGEAEPALLNRRLQRRSQPAERQPHRPRQ
jgi:hypothetical protein